MSFFAISRLDTSNLFESGHLSHDLGRRSVRGGITTMSSQGVSFVLNLARTMILTRLLSPSDFGIISMVMVVVGFANMFKDAGLSMSTVQQEEITEGQISTLFWCNFVLSLFLGLCVLLASPFVAMFYERPELLSVTAVLSISFLFSGLTIQHQAIMNRHMMFTQLAYINIVTQIFSLLVAAILVWCGWRYWALVGSMLAQVVSNLALVFLYCPWIPKRPAKGTGVRSMLKFGGILSLNSFVGYCVNWFDRAAVGKMAGETELGYYDRGYAILFMPLNNLQGPLLAVTSPAMCRAYHDKELYRRYFEKVNSLLSLVVAPLILFLAWNGKDVVLFICGEKWLPAVPLFQALSLGGLFMPIANLLSTVAISSEHPGKLVRWRIISFWIYPLSFFLAYWKFGIVGGAAGRSIGYLLLYFPSLIYITKNTGIIVSRVILVIIRNFSIAAAANVIVYSLHINIFGSFALLVILLVIFDMVLPMRVNIIKLIKKGFIARKVL